MAKLYYRYGAMGSSKSANILMVRYNYEEREQYAVLLKPKVDNRDGERVIQSRIGLSAPAGYVDEFLEEIADVWKKEDEEHFYHGQKVDAVLVDEAQFLTPEEVDILSDLVDFYEIPVHEPSVPGIETADGDCRCDRGSSDCVLVWTACTVQHPVCGWKDCKRRSADHAGIE